MRMTGRQGQQQQQQQQDRKKNGAAVRAAASSGPGLFACVPVALVPLPPLCTPQVQYVHGARRSEPFVLLRRSPCPGAHPALSTLEALCTVQCTIRKQKVVLPSPLLPPSPAVRSGDWGYVVGGRGGGGCNTLSLELCLPATVALSSEAAHYCCVRVCVRVCAACAMRCDAMRGDAMRPATFSFEIPCSRTEEKVPGHPPALFLSGLVLGLYDPSAVGGGGGDAVRPAHFSTIFLFSILGSARFDHPLTSEPVCLSVWYARREAAQQQPATRGDATVIEFMQNAARSHAGSWAGLGWLAGWVGWMGEPGVATATATVLLPFIAQPHLPQPPQPPPVAPHRLCCAMPGCPRATYAPCCCCRRRRRVRACLLSCCRASAGRIWGTSQIHALWA